MKEEAKFRYFKRLVCGKILQYPCNDLSSKFLTLNDRHGGGKCFTEKHLNTIREIGAICNFEVEEV